MAHKDRLSLGMGTGEWLRKERLFKNDGKVENGHRSQFERTLTGQILDYLYTKNN